ncbi:MAG: TrmB family transcriptional regulator [Candidatus Hodarchaeales archaeon]
MAGRQETSVNDNEMIIKNLRITGLTEYGAKAFLELYRKSPQRAKDISNASGISQGRIYEVLQKLTEQGLVVTHTALGTPNIYAIASFPECLERLMRKKVNEIEKAFTKAVDALKTLSREKIDLVEGSDYSLIKGERLSYYVKKVMNEAKKEVKMNFTPELIKKFSNDIVKMQKRGVNCKFVLPIIDLHDKEVKKIVKGGEIYAISLEHLNNPLMEVFKDLRPTMIIVDDKISVIVFFMNTKDGLLVNDKMLLEFQKSILDRFIMGAEKVDPDEIGFDMNKSLRARRPQ